MDGKSATTHWMDIDRLVREFEKVTVQRGVKYVDEGSIITAGGISAGIKYYLHKGSIGFHTRIGFEMEKGNMNIDGIPVYSNYDGPGQDRVLFVRRL